MSAAGRQPAGLLGEQLDGLVVGQRAERLHQLAGRAHAPQRQHAVLVRHLARDPRARLVQLVDAILEAMERQARAGAAERVGRQQVRAGVGVRGMDDAKPVRVLDVPDLGRRPGHQPGGLQHGADRSVAQHRPCVAQQCLDVAHHTSSSICSRASS